MNAMGLMCLMMNPNVDQEFIHRMIEQDTDHKIKMIDDLRATLLDRRDDDYKFFTEVLHRTPDEARLEVRKYQVRMLNTLLPIILTM